MTLIHKTLTLALLASLSTSALAADTVSVQGHLYDADGFAIDEELPLDFTLYTAANGGDAVWSESLDVRFDLGAFTVYLGETASLDGVFGDDLWLGIAVDGDREMDRLRVGMVPVASYAHDAATLDGKVPEDFKAADWQPAFSELGGVPADLADGDDVRDVGEGLLLTGNEISADASYIAARATEVCYDTPSELISALNGSYLPASYLPSYNDLTDLPADLADGDDVLQPGMGLVGSGGVVSVDPSWVKTKAVAAVAATGAYPTKEGPRNIKMYHFNVWRIADQLHYQRPDGGGEEILNASVPLNSSLASAENQIGLMRVFGVDTVLALNIDAVGSRTCTIQKTNGIPTLGFYSSTDRGNSVTVNTIWGQQGVRTLMIRRRGETGGAPLANGDSFGIVCF